MQGREGHVSRHQVALHSLIHLCHHLQPICLQGGVVLGADTRSTAGTRVADKNCEKIHCIAPNIFCCGAGTAADTKNVGGPALL